MRRLVFENPKVGKVWLWIAEKTFPLDIAADTPVPHFKVEGMELVTHDLSFPPDEAPTFFEWQRVTWNFQPAAAGIYSLTIEGKEVHKARVAPQDAPFAHEVQLHAFLGPMAAEICSETGEKLFRLEYEVFPHRIGYQRDFQELKSEMASLLGRLALSGRKRPRGGYSLRSSPESPEIGGLHKITQLKEVLDLIQANPASKLQPSRRWVADYQVKKPDLARMKRQSRQRRAVLLYPERHAARHIDLPANRWLLQQITLCRQGLTDIPSLIPLHTELQRLGTYLKHFQERAIWQEVDVTKPNEMPPMQLLPPLYRLAGKLMQDLLNQSLQPSVSLPAFELKNLPLLYEYVCFLKAAEIIRDQLGYELIEHHLVWDAGAGLTLSLKKGQESYLRFKHTHKGDSVTLWYNRRFSNAITGGMTQQPDILMDIQKQGYSETFRYVLEVKYQLEKSREGWGPPAEGLKQAHRYRDALVSERVNLPHGRGGVRVLQAVVLFPLPAREKVRFLQHPAYQSISQVGLGGLPVLPRGENPLLEDWIRRQLEGPIEFLWEERAAYYPDSQRERDTLISESIGIVSLKEGKYLPEIKRFIRSQRAYGFPFSGPIPDWKGILLVSGNRLWVRGSLKSLRVVSAAELKSLGVSWPLRAPGGRYLLTELEDWEELHIPIHTPLPAQTNQLALRMSIEAGNSALLHFDSLEWIRRYHEILAYDPRPTFGWEEGHLHFLDFSYKKERGKLFRQEGEWQLFWRQTSMTLPKGGNISDFLRENL